MNPNMPSHTSMSPPDDDDALQALWTRQERAFRHVRDRASAAIVVGRRDAENGPSTDADNADDLAYRALFASLAREPMPGLPEDFARNTAAAAERLADARRHVARFRKFWSRLLGLLYLPAMLLVGAMYIPKMWRAMPPDAPGGASIGGWLLAVVVLGLLSFLVDRWHWTARD